jgi:molybdopterin converting factor small subunit
MVFRRMRSWRSLELVTWPRKMSIKVKIPGYLQDKTDGESVVEVAGSTVRECLGELVQRHPALKGEVVDGQGMLLVKWLIFVNRKLVHASDELSTPVTEGDVIQLVPMVAGG